MMPEINIILIYRKLGSVGPIQQKIKLPLPYGDIQKYTDIWCQSASRMQLLGVKKWCTANIFLTPNR